MFKLLKRFLAYTIDMMVVMLIAQSLSGVPFLNRQLDNYNKYTKQYQELAQNYSGFKVDLTNDYKDNKLTTKEYSALIEDYPDYKELLDKYYDDQKITKSEYKKINTKIDKDYQNNYEKVYYKIEKNSIVYFIIYLIAVFAYFIGFNKLTNGQTLGKKLTRLKIINSKDSKKEVPIWSYLIRTLILYQPIYYLVKLITINFLSMNEYYTITSIFYDIQYYLEMLIIIMVMIRIDGRGPHDLLAKTRVIMLDNEGKEIISPYESLVNKKLKNKKNKVIDEPNNE